MALRLQVDPTAPSGYRLTADASPQARRRLSPDTHADEIDPAPELPPLPGQADPATIPLGTVRGEMTDDGRANVYVWSGNSWELVASNEIVAAELLDVTIFQSDRNYAPGEIVLYLEGDGTYTMWEALERAFEGELAPSPPEWVEITTAGGGSGGGGTDEVWINVDPPIDPAIELWYDPDAASVSAIPVSYFHTQGTAATTWTVTHNLGWYPNVTVMDSGGTTVEGDITHVSVNALTITFAGAFSGKAYLS